MKTGKIVLKELIALVITAAVGLIFFYVSLPALNLQSTQFYVFAAVILAVYFVARVPAVAQRKEQTGKEGFGSKAYAFFPLAGIAVLVVLFVVFSVASLEIFNAERYKNLLPIEQGDFTKEVKQITYDQIPMLDKDSAKMLGDRKMGDLEDMVSQFNVADDYVQINYKNKPVRVTELEYAGFFKWMTNRKQGLPGYILIDMVTQETELVRLEDGMKYSPSEYLGRNISRYVRFQHPTMMLGAPGLEVDDAGVPYWISPHLVKRIGMFGGTDVEGAVFVNAITGEEAYYKLADVPNWADRICPAELVIQQYDYYGAYQNGFFNSIFGQKGVTKTTELYNYIAQNDDVYVYTGVTSVNSDQSNIGFILVNQRTKEAKYYPSSGATETSAQGSAEGVVTDLKYRATAPILLNINNQATYFMALKDNIGLVKMYAMVNVSQYQKVATATTVAQCEKNYIKLMQGSAPAGDAADNETIKGVVDDIKTAVREGFTWYYVRVAGKPEYYVQSIEQDFALAVLSVGDSVEITFSGEPIDGVVTATQITKK